MAMMTALFFHAFLLFNLPSLLVASDADPLNDYCITDTTTKGLLFNGLPCKPSANVTSSDFTSSIISNPGNVGNALGLSVILAGGANFGALNTQGLAIARIDLAPNGFVPPHIHPRASELLVLVEGSQLVGFIDSNQKLFTATVCAGEAFVFPRGLVHYQLNVGNGSSSFALASFNSQNPGLSLVASALFGSTPPVPDVILEKTFQLTQAEVEHLKKAFHS